MMHFLFYVLILFQIPEYPGQNECTFQDYSNLITKALNLKYENQPIEANRIFKLAFSTIETPLGKDLEEALEIAIEHDDKHANLLVIKLLKGGIPIRYFQKYESLNERSWFEDIRNDHQKYTAYFKSHFNQDLRRNLLKLRSRDSIFNVEFHQFRKGERYKKLDRFIEEAEGISTSFLELVKEYGFPSEQKIGYWLRYNEIQFLPTRVILIHIHQTGDKILQNHFTFQELVCAGNLSEFDYDLIHDMSSIDSSIKARMTSFYTKYKDQY
ncbi:MAG: hypothetical protein P1U56_21160 [Saprospiraceae bacterium]|nr:hypothetical protein [Saprospiraceae bacterium]